MEQKLSSEKKKSLSLSYVSELSCSQDNYSAIWKARMCWLIDADGCYYYSEWNIELVENVFRKGIVVHNVMC